MNEPQIRAKVFDAVLSQMRDEGKSDSEILQWARDRDRKSVV